MNITEPGRLADFIASSLSTITTAIKQEVLETLDIRARMDNLNRILIKELEVLELGSKIQSQVQSEVGKNQREYFLREQMKAIQKELGEGDDQTKEAEELLEKIEAAGMPEAMRNGTERTSSASGASAAPGTQSAGIRNRRLNGCTSMNRSSSALVRPARAAATRTWWRFPIGSPPGRGKGGPCARSRGPE